MQQIKWGILGTSWISEVMAEAIKESAQSELVAIAGRTLQKATAFAHKHSVPIFYDDYEAILQHPLIDAVYIGLPNHLHKEWIIRCARAGKHILCEKPFVLDLQEAELAFAAVRQNNVFCMEGLMYRCHPFITQLQDLIESKIIGAIKCITAVYTADIADVANKTAGGAIRNLGCYPLSLTRLLTKQEPLSILAQSQKDNERDALSTAIFNFANGIMATITTADNIKMWPQFTVLGSAGILDVLTNPWLPAKINKVKIKTATEERILEFHANQSLFSYQIDYVAGQIIKGICQPDAAGISWEHTLGNTTALEKWLRKGSL